MNSILTIDERNEQLLLTFIYCYAISTHKHLKTFVKGLKTDIAAVTNAVLLQYSNGYLDGNNSRLKMINRTTMYGRAGLPLLKAKIIIKLFCLHRNYSYLRKNPILPPRVSDAGGILKNPFPMFSVHKTDGLGALVRRNNQFDFIFPKL